jgi:hypothetical protein
VATLHLVMLFDNGLHGQKRLVPAAATAESAHGQLAYVASAAPMGS